jgi:hypothetical protein
MVKLRFALVRDASHRFGMAFAIEVCRRSNMKEYVLHFWFARRAEGVRKARLHGWRLWYTHCVENDYLVETMTSPQCDPVMLIGELMISMDRQGVKNYRIREGKVAFLELFEFVQRDKFKDLVANCNKRIPEDGLCDSELEGSSSCKINDIWPLRVLLQHIQNGSPAEQLSGTKLMVRTAALVVIFIPCRRVAKIRMDWSKIR